MAQKKGKPGAAVPPHTYKAFHVPADLIPLGDYAKEIIHRIRLDYEANKAAWKNKGKRKD